MITCSSFRKGVCYLASGQGTRIRQDFLWSRTLAFSSYVAPSNSEILSPQNQARKITKISAKELDFSSHKFAFRHKTTSELLRGLLVLHACSFDTLVNHSYRLLTTGERILGDKLLSILVSPFYNQFVAGDTEDNMATISHKLHDVRVKLMIAPMLETDVGEGHDLEAMYWKNFNKTMYLIELCNRQSVRSQSWPICQTKHTAHLSADVLARISTAYEALSEEQQTQAIEMLSSHIENAGKDSVTSDISEFEGFDINPFPPLTLTKEDTRQLMASLNRFYKLGEKCVNEKVVLAVDAEYTYTNPAINLITLAMMKIFNRRKPVVWNTYQGYLKAGRKNLEHDLRMVRALGNFGFGAKLVRGAYLERERSFALECGNSDPVNDTYEDTGKVYNSMVDLMFNEVQEDSEGRCVIVATHNEDAVRKAAAKLEEMNLDPHAGNVVFGQVYGMAENITLPLAHCGYLVYKSVPYGSMIEVMPYLSRRANENRAVLRGARKERELLTKELLSRLSVST